MHTMAHWIALQPELADARAGGSELIDPVQALGWWALGYTPKVARCNDVLLLEVAASARLWGVCRPCLSMYWQQKSQ
jgi:protein ImuB